MEELGAQNETIIACIRSIIIIIASIVVWAKSDQNFFKPLAFSAVKPLAPLPKLRLLPAKLWGEKATFERR
jgi:hypothetical protein